MMFGAPLRPKVQFHALYWLLTESLTFPVCPVSPLTLSDMGLVMGGLLMKEPPH